MAEIVNLNRRRKQKARAEAAAQAAENRVRFGRTKAEKRHEAAVREEEQRRFEQLKREPDRDGA